MGQTRKRSWCEAWSNIAVGFAITFTANMFILPLFGFDNLTMRKNLALGGIYTMISLLRSYGLRRWYNRRDDYKK